jgi:hypothetical protein
MSITKTTIATTLLSTILVSCFALSPITAKAADSRVTFSNGMIVINLVDPNSANKSNNNQVTQQLVQNNQTAPTNSNNNDGTIKITFNNGNNQSQPQQQYNQPPTQNFSNNNGVIKINLVGANNQTPTNYQPNTNQQNNSSGGDSFTIPDSQLYSLPAKFNSADKINSYLASQGSVLANYEMDFGFENDDDILTTGRRDGYDPAVTMAPYLGKKMRFADFVWKLSQTNMGNVCSIYNSSICFNKQINPAFILGMIQRESGLIYGSNAQRKSDTNFLIDRATGYFCYETSNKAEGCWDENPSWRFYKGLFKQTYFMYRNLALNSVRCDNAGINMSGNYYRSGNTILVDGENIKLDNGINCALYIYTPHAFAQKSLQKVFNYINN